MGKENTLQLSQCALYSSIQNVEGGPRMKEVAATSESGKRKVTCARSPKQLAHQHQSISLFTTQRKRYITAARRGSLAWASTSRPQGVFQFSSFTIVVLFLHRFPELPKLPTFPPRVGDIEIPYRQLGKQKKRELWNLAFGLPGCTFRVDVGVLFFNKGHFHS